MGRLICAAALSALLTGCGITGNFRNDPGYAAFGSLQRLESTSGFSLSLGPLPLKLAGWVVDRHEPELRPLLDDLRGVRVYTFELARPVDGLVDAIEKLKTDLLAEGWVSVITVREDAEVLSVLLRPGERGGNRGLTVIAQEPDEVVLVNLIGNVRLDLFAGYMAELDVETPRIEIDPATLQARLLSGAESSALRAGSE